MAITKTQEQGQWPLLGEQPEQPSSAGKLLKEALDDVRVGFARKVGGLVAAQMLMTVLASALFCCLPEVPQRRLAKWAISLTFVLILALSICPQSFKRHPADLCCLFGLTATQAALIAPAVTASSMDDIMAAVAATVAALAVFAAIERVMRSELADLEPHLFAGMLALYPWGFLLVLMAVFHIPVSPLAQASYDSFSSSAVALCALADVRHVLGGAGAGRRFGVDSAGLAAMSLHYGAMHLFLKFLCLTMSASREGQQLAAVHPSLE
eukprot:CAMPEP_0171243126 /NCGR_PEP_ID=MMETSP0790-20130122/46109_1 /TAXON_ID=2925 /ORGANISM="Alexandrium catenella, Strain OF101" /LENGTH=266 /DNA_ID=CAMNT_0011710075 /DNA_START=19 /DNA_END=819 /DNA_ORIENTATION=+